MISWKAAQPLFEGASPEKLRALAREIRREADELEARAAEIETAQAEREKRAERHRRRMTALQELRDLLAAGIDPHARIEAVATKYDLRVDSLATAFAADRRRFSRAEREARDLEFARLARLGHSNAVIAAAAGVSTRTVELGLRRTRHLISGKTALGALAEKTNRRQAAATVRARAAQGRPSKRPRQTGGEGPAG